MTLDQLSPGQEATVIGFADDALGTQLLEMGMVPGDPITLERVAPMGDPIAVRTGELLLILRRKEASTVEIRTA
jgi:ferrous iron transport protein A